ncbi:PPBT protein, partial [Acromyrmex insinuator]
MRRYPLHINVALTVVLLAMCATVVRAGKREREVWYETATRAIETRIREAASTSVSGTTPPTGMARGVVLFVGDGMGMSTLTAARILAGQRHGNPGEETQLAWESFPAVALARVSTRKRRSLFILFLLFVFLGNAARKPLLYVHQICCGKLSEVGACKSLKWCT